MLRHGLTYYFPVCAGLKAAFRQGYRLKHFKGDLSAALVVSMISLPLSMALAIAVGLPPQHGIATAIVGGIAASILGGSRFQISGPTAAFVVVLIPIVSEFGLRGLIWCQILAGLILLTFAFAKLGRLINYVPYPVTTGFTTGIALVLATISMKDFLGLPSGPLAHHFTDKVWALLVGLPELNWAALAVGLMTIGIMLFANKKIRWLPSPIAGVIGGTLLGTLALELGFFVPTIGTEFTYVDLEGIAQMGIPAFPPTLGLPTFIPDQLLTLPTLFELKSFFLPAMIIATLAALESLLSANIADNVTGTRHHSNSELNGIGLANVLSGLASGIPATAAIARTATNIQNGAYSPIAGCLNGLLILLYIVCLTPVIARIPMSVLAALLLMTAYNMSHMRQFMNIIKIAPSSDRSVLLTCFAFTVFIDMVAGVTMGILLSVLLFLKRIAETTEVQLSFSESRTLKNAKEVLPKNVMWFKIDGPLFFGTVEKAYDRTHIIHHDIDTVIIDMEKVPYIDMTGMIAMQSVLSSMAANRMIYLCGRQEVLNKILRKLPFDISDKLKLCANTAEATAQILAALPPETEPTEPSEALPST